MNLQSDDCVSILRNDALELLPLVQAPVDCYKQFAAGMTRKPRRRTRVGRVHTTLLRDRLEPPFDGKVPQQGPELCICKRNSYPSCSSRLTQPICPNLFKQRFPILESLPSFASFTFDRRYKPSSEYHSGIG